MEKNMHTYIISDVNIFHEKYIFLLNLKKL